MSSSLSSEFIIGETASLFVRSNAFSFQNVQSSYVIRTDSRAELFFGANLVMKEQSPLHSRLNIRVLYCAFNRRCSPKLVELRSVGLLKQNSLVCPEPIGSRCSAALHALPGSPAVLHPTICNGTSGGQWWWLCGAVNHSVVGYG